MPTKKPSPAKPAAKAKAAASAPRRERPTAAKPAARPAAKGPKPEPKKAKPAPAPKPVAKAPSAPKPTPKPEPKAKAAAKPAPKPEPKAKVKPAPTPKTETKLKPAPAAKAAAKPAPKPEPKPAPEPKAKPAKAAKPEPAKPVVPPKPAKPRVAPVTTKTAPIITRPSRPPVASGSGARPLAPVARPAPKPLAAPKPVAQPEIVGEPQPVPAFKAKSTTAPTAKSLVLVGAIAGAFGVRGEVRLRAFTAEKTGIIAYGPLYNADGKTLLKPKSWRELKDGVAVVAPEVKTREEAEKLRGTRLYVPRANLPAPADDEFYIVDLLGCRAEALDGHVLGDIVAVWNFGAGDVLEYRPPNGGPNQRITFTKETAPLVDLAGKRVVLDPPPPEEATA